MSHQIPDRIPDIFEAGDLIQWKNDFSDYPATTESWTLTHYFRGATAAGAFAVTAAASADSFLSTIATTTSATFTADTYYVEAYVSKTGARHKVWTGKVKVEANFASATTADNRTDAQIIRDTLRTLCKTAMSRPEASVSFSVGGQTFTYKSYDEIIKAYRFWQGEAEADDLKELTEQGRSTKRNILVTFTEPT